MVVSATADAATAPAGMAETGPSAMVASRRSPGRLRCTGPGRPPAAIWSARAMSTPMCAASSTRQAALVTGRAAPT